MSAFRDRVALVTGGTSGIGRATAIAFAKEGSKVVLAGRRENEGQKTLQLVRDAGSDGAFVKTDVTDGYEVSALVARAVRTFGRLDFAFNNAGVEQDAKPLTEQSEDEFERIMGTNVKGVWLCMKHEAPAIVRGGGGAIVNCASVAGVVGVARMSIYVASKHAVVGLTRSAALEFAGQRVRINALCPGVIDTDMVRRTPGVAGEVLRLTPMGRLGRPEEMADVVLWLCSERASFVTGQAILADGGFTVA